jgi:hypothetical protein
MAHNTAIAAGKTVKYAGVTYTIKKQVGFGNKDITRTWECEGQVIVRTLRMMRCHVPLGRTHTHIEVITLSEKQILTSWKKDEPIRQPQSAKVRTSTIKSGNLPFASGSEFLKYLRGKRDGSLVVA